MSDISKQIGELSPEKRELLELLLKKEGLRAKNELAPRGRGAEHFPLTHGQKAMWFLQQLEPENAAYNISTALRILTPPDVPALRRAFQRMVDRHTSLRTTFEAADGEPVQRVHERAEVSFQETDASGLSETELHDLLVTEARRPFDLGRGPLFRVHLFARSGSEHVLLMVMHHIITDLWSQVILTHELEQLYPAEQAGAGTLLPPVELQFTDYVLWQADELAGAEGERRWAYWREQLAGELPVLNMPTDRPRPPMQTYRGASQTIRLDAGLTRELKALAQAHGATLYMTMLAAYAALLYRHTGQEDILIGSPTTGRDRPELANVVGYFVNSVVLRADLSGGPTFSELVGRMRRTVLGAFEHQDYPFALLAERLHPSRDFSRPPIFQTTFVVQKSQMAEQQGLASFVQGEVGARMNIGGLLVELMPVYKGTSQFDLRMAVAEAGDELSVLINYNTDLFDASTITRLLDHFQVMLAGVVADPNQSVYHLPLLTEQELHQILVQWNDTAAPYPRDMCINEVFEAQAEKTPDAVAVVHQEEGVTYSDLNARANQLAHHLRSLGVGPEELVGICVERSADMVAALMGILKAGGAYVSLDPAYPKERLAFMLQDARIKVLVTQQQFLVNLPEHDARVVCLDADAEAIAGRSKENLSCEHHSGNAAYVIYTSGSTGVPKGVVIEHRSTVALLYWARSVFSPEDLSCVLASASINFDCSVFEIFVTLSWGGRIVLAKNALELPSLPAAQSITLLNTVPSSMGELLKVGGVPDTVRTVNLSADSLPRALVDQVFQKTKAERVFNGYGPTEDTTFTTFGLVERDASGNPPIGRPISNEQVYLLDRHLNLVPVGVPGELYVGGDGLARGYLNRPELTAEKFIPDPFSSRPGSRLYRTGDVARHLPDGNIEFVSRVDHQVKVRGFRVELGEVASALRRHAAVQDAAVTASADPSGNKRLVAYFAAKPGQSATTSDLRGFLKESLPEFMVPSVFVPLDRLPMLPSGKVNLRALPAPDWTRPELSEAYEPPRTPIEEVLARIWMQVLGVERVGVRDNFFELGGHSLLATQVVAEIGKAFGLQIPLWKIFELPTVAELSESVEAGLKAGHGLQDLPIERVPHDRESAPTFAQESEVYHEKWAREASQPLAPFVMNSCHRIEGPLDLAVLEQVFNEVVRRHEVFRTTFHQDGERIFQRIAEYRPAPFSVVDFRHLPEAEREAEARKHVSQLAQVPFDHTGDILMRVNVARMGDDDHLVLLTVSHLIYDALSDWVLLSDVAALYNAFTEGKPSPLAELKIQFADYAQWERQWLQGENWETLVSYWRRQLNGMKPYPELKLPEIRPLPEARTYESATSKLKLPAELSSSLSELCRRRGVTLYMLLVAALKALLHRYTGEQMIGVLTAEANRDRPETQNLIGYFVNYLVLYTDVSGDPSFSDLLQRVRQTTLGAFVHKGLPFSQLLEVMDYWEFPPKPYIHFCQIQSDHTRAPRLPGLTIRRAPIDLGNVVTEPGLRVNVLESEEGFTMYVTYESERYEGATIQRLLDDYRALLEEVAADPERRLSEFSSASGVAGGA